MIRNEIKELISLGQFPSSHTADLELIKRQQDLLASIETPVSRDEALGLLHLFGPDDYFGLAWTVIHLIKSAPNWPYLEALEAQGNAWVQRLMGEALNL